MATAGQAARRRLMEMRFEDRGERSGIQHMELDAALLLVGEPVAVIYGWSQPHVTLGKFQTVSETLVDPSLTSYSVRPTGGGAVLHGHDVTLCIVVPLQELKVHPREVKRIYRLLAKPIVEAMKSSGVNAILAEEAGFTTSRRSDYCFAMTSPNDIIEVRSQRKVCGCAMIVTDQSVLLQVSIPVSEPQISGAEILNGYIPISSIDLDRKQFWSQLKRELVGLGT